MLSTEVVDVTARELSENVVSENAVSGKIVSCNAVSENIANDSVKLEKKYKSKKKEPKSKKKEPEYISQFVSVEVKELSTGRKQVIKADSCIIATGGNSYSSTGSTGDGYRFAKSLYSSLRLSPILSYMLIAIFLRLSPISSEAHSSLTVRGTNAGIIGVTLCESAFANL